MISVGKQLLSYPFVVCTRHGWVECRLAMGGQLEWVIALRTHACFGRSVDLSVGAATLIVEWVPSTLFTE